MNRFLGLVLLFGFLVSPGCDSAKQQAEKAKDAAKGAAEKAKDAAGEAMEAAKNMTIDGVDVGKDFGDWVSGLTATLDGIKDKASAESAVSALKEADTKFGTMLGLFDKLPDAGKTAFKGVLGPALAKLKSAVEKVTGIPGVGDIVKPVLDGIIEKLTKAAG